MNSLKRIAAAALSAALCFSIAVPAYADHYQTPKSIKGVLINEHAQIPDVLEVGASQVVLNFPMSWAFSSQLSVCQDLYTKLDQAGVTVTLIVLNDWQQRATARLFFRYPSQPAQATTRSTP